MTATLKGTSESEVIPPNTMLQLVFGATHSFTNDEEFAKRFGEVWNNLAPRAGLFPVSRSSVRPGVTTTTVDATTHTARTAGEITTAVEALCGYFVELRSLARLSPAEKAKATTPAGAVVRDQVAAKSAAAAATDNPLTKAWHGLEEFGNVAKWVVIAAVFFGLLIFAGKLRKDLA